MTIFIERRPYGIDQFRALMNQPFSSAKIEIALLCCSSDFGSTKPHLWSLSRNYDRFSVSGIIFSVASRTA
ncbi:hypothetical protein [Sphingobium sp. Ant17]|uniref:hypothetical protein n=1 Tax=Sphingobium sp. Ant17 TaxID=1461752 RepID=UPI00190F47C6|nr:hypothetical protein [Sphingobium sp. Ant17]